MKDRKSPTMLGVVAGAVAVTALLAIAGLFVVYTGAYNVAATEEHASVTRWAFHTTMHSSVESRADGVAPPGAITPEMVAAGATSYKAMCQHCHAGPGVERAEWASGMRPRPPHLAEAAAEWEPEEVFWIVKHGIKMTGMPAFGPTHGEEALWGIAAFVDRLPALTPEEYAALGDTPPPGDGHHADGRGGAGEAGGSHTD